MMYITIPKGMKFKKCTFDQEVDGMMTQVTKDCFVTIENENKPFIVLQDLIRKALRERKKEGVTYDDVTIYFKNPGKSDVEILCYAPNRDGLEPTASAPSILVKKSNSSRYGELWFHKIPVSSEKAEEIKESRKKQSEDRRHTGDSPKAT